MTPQNKMVAASFFARVNLPALSYALLVSVLLWGMFISLVLRIVT